MRRIGAMVALLCALGWSSSAMAEGYVSAWDPSGAPMCFTTTGAKAPLDRCQVPEYVSKADPTGAPMCFTAAGEKAPLSRCKAPTYISDVDPSGAPVCFDRLGDKAPLAKCALFPKRQRGSLHASRR